MSPKDRRFAKAYGPVLSSRKDRLGVVLLLLGVLFYWFISRPDVAINTRWHFKESPLERKLPRNKLSKVPHPYQKQDKYHREYPPYANRKNYNSQNKNRIDSLSRGSSSYSKKTGVPLTKAIKLISLNNADSMDWEQLPGIGPTLATRIIKYREKLGGFHSVSQLQEVFGIADSVYQKISSLIKEEEFQELRKIDINKASLEEMKKHPYIRWETAKLIVRYREANGLFHSLGELKSIWNISEETFKRMEPYLCIKTDSLRNQ